MTGSLRTGGRALWGVAASALLLAVGWPLVNTAMADERRVTPGEVTVGDDANGSATVTVGPGWTMKPAETDKQHASLGFGNAALALSLIDPLDEPTLPAMWEGVRKAYRVTAPNMRIGSPSAAVTGAGDPALVSTVVNADRSGTVTLIRGPDGKFFVKALATADGGTDRVMVVQALRTLVIKAGSS